MQTLESLDNFAAHLEACSRPGDAMVLRSFIAELRAQLAPCGPDGKMAQSNSSHFRAWAAVVDVLNEVRGTQRNWGADDSLAPRDAAVAAIRSMAAQCSAQPAPRPATPCVTDYDLETLAAAIGVLYANDPVDDPIKLRLVDLFKSLRTNAPQE